MALALSGLASSLDTDAIVTQLMTVEKKSQTRLKLDDLKAQSRQETLQAVASRLRALRDATAALKSASTWADVQATTSSDSARVAVRAPAGAAPGEHTVAVTALATAAQRAYTVGAGGGTITIGAFTLDVAAGTDAAGVATALNARSDAPVSAVVAGGALVLTARQSGAASTFAVDAGGPLTEQPAYARAGSDAVFTVDGVGTTSPSNVVTNAILGVELTLKATTGTAAVVAVGAPGPDRGTIRAAVQTFVDAYNSAVDLVRGELAEKQVPAPTTNAEALQGLFRGDTLLIGALSSLRQALGDVSDLGISTGASTGAGTVSKDAVAGRLRLDATKLDAALTSAPATLRERLGGADGLADRLAAVVAPLAGERIDARLEAATAERKRLADALAFTDTRLALREKTLRAQFAAMETALAAAQSQQSWLTGQLGALQR
jgi:flagellar hook-associated protein 2